MTNHEARALMGANGGLLTTQQARDSGLTSRDIRHLLTLGHLVVVRRGVYADGEVWRSLDDDRGQHLLRTRAAIRTMRRGFAVSHDSAGHEHGLEILLPPDPHVHISRPGSTNAWTKYGVKHHLARFRRDQVVHIDGLPVLDLARTAVDIAREHGEPYGEIACDAAMRHGVTRAALEAAYAPMVSWQHINRVRRAVSFADPGAQTLAETLGRILVAELGLGEIDTQFPMYLPDGRVGWIDMRIGCHRFEVDGRFKYQLDIDGGLAEDPPHEVVWADKKRDRDIDREGLGSSHIVWRDFWPPHRAEALKRLRQEWDDTVARFGTVLPERLARQAREIRAQRRAPGS